MSEKLENEISLKPSQSSLEAAATFAEFVEVVAKLRDPVHGCPWDLQQSHQSLRRYMLEEAYEASEAMSEGRSEAIIEELGDVLLQVVLNSQLLKDDRNGSIHDVVRAIRDKMLRRHPHVFSPESKDKNLSPEEIKQQWTLIKAEEKAANGENQDAQRDGNQSVFNKAKSTSFPATLQAYEIGKIAKKIGFDWSHPRQVLQQLEAEVEELKQEIDRPAEDYDQSKLLNELGDVYFTLAQVSRHLGIDPEVAAQEGNLKFLRRFAKVEQKARDKNQNVNDLKPEELEGLWLEVKQEQQKQK